MGRRRIDWIQFALLVVTLLAAAVHVERRIARIEQHLVDQDRDNTLIQQRLERIETQTRR